MTKRPNFRERRDAEWAEGFKRIRLKDVGPVLDDGPFSQLHARVCPCGSFPRDYVAFLRAHNGGQPQPAHFKWTHPKEGQWVSKICMFFQLHPGPFDRPLPHADMITATLARRDD